jgi:nicotinamidase-related amidase
MGDTALLVVDVQESFRQRHYFRTEHLPSFFDRMQKLVDGAKAKGWAVAQIFHVEPTPPFSIASGWVRPMPEITYKPDVVVRKTSHSALAGGSTLPDWLTSKRVSHVVVCGIRTEQCCETTARHASDLGYQVDFVTEATLTFPMRHFNGRKYSVEDLREQTELVLHDRFAQVTTVDDLLAR